MGWVVGKYLMGNGTEGLCVSDSRFCLRFDVESNLGWNRERCG